MSERLEHYSAAIDKLVAEAIACSPPSWSVGTLAVACDGRAITYSIKNDGELEKAQISADLRSLCEALYVTMRDRGDDWTQAEIRYFKKDDASWRFDVDFKYANAAVPENVVSASPQRRSLWKSLVRHITPTPAWSKDPEALVKEFIRDFQRWNDDAHAKSENDDSEAGTRFVKSTWKNLIDKFCPANFDCQWSSYGTESKHDPSKEQFVSVESGVNHATIKTRVQKFPTFYLDYEYELKRENDRWFLQQIYYVDEGGKFPSL
jgi:hypothetical protein